MARRACEPRIIAAQGRCSAGRSTARARRSAQPRPTSFSTGRWTSSAWSSQTTSASAKGEAIAEALMKRRALLVLDGVEPLQHGPGPQAGQLKDQGLRALLRRFAAAPPGADHSLIVLTSRIAVADIHRFEKDAAPVVDVERLSEEAGAELLRDNDVWGIDKELKASLVRFRRPSARADAARELSQGNAKRRRAPARPYPRPARRRRQPAARPRAPRDGILRKGMARRTAYPARDSPSSSACSTAPRAAIASRRCAPSRQFAG